jgi:ABC-2 type transport system ATP-binding protein/lipopolysaccharide transport system ATP-binding protein
MPAIKLQGVAKKYRLHGSRPRNTTLMSYVLRDMWKHPPTPEVKWALRDVNLVVDHGSTIGVIGPNGSGKSTLVKLIHRILKPDQGTISVRGNTVALVELGAGFHPELTGRENLWVSGIIFGLSKQEIRANFDRIVEFAELGPYIDEPVRTYSTGMCMRLGFAVAVHAHPDIFLLDEVFAVGDAAFKKKCIERMRAFKESGKTILLVTHDLPLVESWCDQAAWLHAGTLRLQGKPRDVIQAYTQSVS